MMKIFCQIAIKIEFRR